MSIPVTEIKEEARLAILRGLAAQVKFCPADADTFDFQPLLVLARRLGFRQRALTAKNAEQLRATNPFKSAYGMSPEDEYKRYPYRD